ncbi:hypothetical protein CY0110_16837 [Crocosphaera chwakensis CCY0110]|uniref:Uncharacterized protein n=1 Tax=Crocosphaera chwakensis CCY0110 TaxID=391612 RepID=A3II49_9CHRO|nr:hypothetical protein CY0110_16837 [Crocosphaera chwakensis CCY0110]
MHRSLKSILVREVKWHQSDPPQTFPNSIG